MDGYQGPWGLYYEADRCWLGDQDGPTAFEDFDLARLAAAVMSRRLDPRNLFARGVKALPVDRAALVRRPGDLRPEMSGEEALDRLERGR